MPSDFLVTLGTFSVLSFVAGLFAGYGWSDYRATRADKERRRW